MWKLYSIQISASINEVLIRYSQTYLLMCFFCGCFSTLAEFNCDGAMTPKIVTIWTFIENITSLYLAPSAACWTLLPFPCRCLCSAYKHTPTEKHISWDPILDGPWGKRELSSSSYLSGALLLCLCIGKTWPLYNFQKKILYPYRTLKSSWVRDADKTVSGNQDYITVSP